MSEPLIDDLLPDFRHTPGPWRAEIEEPFICGGDHREIVAVTEDGKYVNRGIAGFYLDTAEGEEDDPDFLESLANARLLAAAPDLLIACLMARDVFGSLVEKSQYPAYDDGIHTLEMLRAAIAKATGSEAPR